MSSTAIVPLTPAWTQLRPHPMQSALWRSTARVCVVVAGRGSGKTELALRRVVRYLPVQKPWPAPVYFYALPTFQQAKRVAWEPLKALVPRRWLRKPPNESDLYIETIFGSRLYVVGMDKPERVEGTQWDGGVIDESSDQRPKSFDRSLRPALTHRHGWCWRIGAAKRYGIGAGDFRQAYELGLRGDGETRSFHWSSRDILTPAEIAAVKEGRDRLDYLEQYEGLWQDTGGGVFHAFHRTYNVSEIACYRPDLPVIVGSDFNVNPMCWVLGHALESPVSPPSLHIFDEIVLRNTNTQATLDELYTRLGGHQAGFLFCGDASGRARKTSASESDYLQIHNDERFAGRRVLYPRGNPSRIDRFAACNALFCNAAGQRRCFVHPRATMLIGDLEQRAWREGSREPDDYGDIGHASDALGYVIDMLFPMEFDLPQEAPEVYAT